MSEPSPWDAVAVEVPPRHGRDLRQAAMTQNFGKPPGDIISDLKALAEQSFRHGLDDVESDLQAIARAEAYIDLGVRAHAVGHRRLRRRVLRAPWWHERLADLVDRRARA